MNKNSKKVHSAKEVSAGGLIVSLRRDRWYLLLMKDMKGYWTFPKGKIEEGEDLETTAKREIEEEVGISGLTYVAKLTPSTYWYYRNGAIHKTVHYHLFQSKRRNNPNVQKEEGITEAKWVLLTKAHVIIGYPKTNTPLLTEAQKILKSI